MFPELSPPTQPVAICTDYTVDKTTTFRVQQHGKALSAGKFTIFYPHDAAAPSQGAGATNETGAGPEAQGRTLMNVDGTYMSLHGRRSFTNAAGLPLFELYHTYSNNTVWYVESPGSTGKLLMRIAQRSSSRKNKLDVFVNEGATDGGERALLHVELQDVWQLRTNIMMDDKVVMTVKRTDKAAVYLPGRKLEWDVDIAPGMDMALASVIVVVLAANIYKGAGAGS